MPRQHIFAPGQRKLDPGTLNDISKSTHSARKALSFSGTGSMQTPIGTLQRSRQPGRAGGAVAFDYSVFAFGFRFVTIEGENEGDPPTTGVEIMPGSVRMHGVGSWSLDEAATVSLDPMSAPWVYAQLPRNGGDVTVSASSTEPVSNTTTLKIPLYLFERSEGGTYALHSTLGGIRHIGDVNLDTPLL